MSFRSQRLEDVNNNWKTKIEEYDEFEEEGVMKNE